MTVHLITQVIRNVFIVVGALAYIEARNAFKYGDTIYVFTVTAIMIGILTYIEVKTSGESSKLNRSNRKK